MTPVEFPEAVVLVGGLGTRLRREVADRPKCMAWVGGRYFLAHLLAQLRRAGARRVILATGYRGDQIQAIFGNEFEGMELDYSREDRPLGTGGGLCKAAKKAGSPEILVLNGDSYSEVDFAVLLARHRTHRPICTITFHLAGTASRFGRISADADGRVRVFEEKPGAGAEWINAGIYVIARQELIGREGESAFSLETDLFPEWASRGWMNAFYTEGRFVDIGTPETLWEARHLFREAGNPQFMSVDQLRAINSATREMLRPREASEINRWKLAVGAIIRDKSGRILLERRQDCGLWGLPGGRMDFGETFEQTAKREVREECGLEIEVERLVGAYSAPANRILSYPNGDIVQPITVVLEAAVAGGELLASAESLELRFFRSEELPIDILPSAQDCLMDCLHSPHPCLR